MHRSEAGDATSPAFLQALLFDFDGTIAETERNGHRVAYNRAFAECGLDWEWDVARYGELLAVAGGKERMRHFVANERPDAPSGAELDGLIARVYAAKQRHFAALAPVIALRPGVQRLMCEAHAAGVPVAIATTAAPSGVEAVLARDPEVRATVALIAAGDVVAHKKPAPDIYRWALEKLGVSPACAVALEDSAIGLNAARAAGLTTIVTVSEYTAGEEFAGAAAVLSDLGEPGRPAAVLAGAAPAHGVVDLAFLRTLSR